MTSKRKWVEFLLLNGFSIIVYFIIAYTANFEVKQEIMFASSDSKAYFSVAEWIGGAEETGSISNRPFLYPLMLIAAYTVGKLYGIWLMQLIFWLGVINLTFYSIRKLHKNAVFAIIGTLFIATNLSLIALTYHALTEVLTCFLLASLTHLIVINRHLLLNISFYLKAIFILVCISLLKPAFFYVLLFILFILTPLYYGRLLNKRKVNYLYLILLILPIIFQVTLVKTKYDKLTISVVGGETFKNYLLSQGVQKIKNLSREDAAVYIEELDKVEQLSFALKNISFYVPQFLKNVQGNISAHPTFLFFPKEVENLKLGAFMKTMNKIYLIIHYIFMGLVLIVFSQKIRLQINNISFILYFLALFYILTTGVSFWQGDRLVLPAIAIWVVLYTSLIIKLSRIPKKSW